MIAIPDHINFVDWAGTLQVDLPDIEVPRANSEAEWKTWALSLIEVNNLEQTLLPEQFQNWRDWAVYFALYV